MPNTRNESKKLPKNWPQPKNEEEEARWWDANSERLILRAAERGTLKMSTLEQLVAKAKAKQDETRLLSLRLPVSLINRAKQEASAEGIPYQTLMRGILHRELIGEKAPTSHRRIAAAKKVSWAKTGKRSTKKQTGKARVK